MVGAARLELATPRSQSECATNCATPRLMQFNIKYVNNVTVFAIHCNNFIKIILIKYRAIYGMHDYCVMSVSPKAVVV